MADWIGPTIAASVVTFLILGATAVAYPPNDAAQGKDKGKGKGRRSHRRSRSRSRRSRGRSKM